MKRYGLMSFVILVLASCGVQKIRHIPPVADTGRAILADYKDLRFWAAHPQLTDPSDSVPEPLLASHRADTTADVFFIHPTTFTSGSDTAWNAPLDDSLLNAKTDYSTILYQASVFNEHRVFAPRYRQAHLRSYFTADTGTARAALRLAYSDVQRAFEYYLQHENNGRPIIIASHSQGSTHAMRLLQDYFDGKPMQQQLVVAYIVGMYIPSNSFREIDMCRDSLQTGCIAAWRTFKEGYLPDYVPNETGHGMVTNPLTWTTDDTYAPRQLNRGSVLRNFNRVIERVADAEVKDRVLWVRQVRFPGSMFLRMKNFHIADINLFYVNIRDNVRLRVAQFRRH